LSAAVARRAAFPFAYRREWLGADVVAGLTAAAVVIPQAIAYAVIEMLAEGERNLRERGVTLWLSTLNPNVAAVMRRTALGATLGENRVFPNLRLAVESYLKTPAPRRDPT
jgi:MFS superfamily sulfate permease-like transporter